MEGVLIVWLFCLAVVGWPYGTAVSALVFLALVLTSRRR
jgi:hypothetical protein